ncbi:unnamed protein product [Parnassius apollo]|uniref:(apollo) hypothetical protein n=1 Tax=Parnassius apollo TaxID=110799 RepID=A0A8S3XQ52_PARAO|nr:unnamed protein product [Parnassius apollo]
MYSKNHNTTRTSSPVPSTSSSITNEPAKTENNFMELSESAIYDDTGTESSIDGGRQSKDLWKQTTLIDMFERSSSYEAGGQKTSQINQALIYMICKDNMPLSCVEKASTENAHTADCIKECFENITEEFTIEKDCILSITTDVGANMVTAVKQYLGDGKRIPCMAHLLNLIVDGATRDNGPVLQIANRVKAIVTYFKQSVNAMDDLRAEQEGTKKEGEVLTLIQSVSTRWNSCLDMLERFNTLSAIVAKILATRRNAPDMITSSELSVIRDLIMLLTPFKQAMKKLAAIST